MAYWRYVVGILVALFAIPAFLQGGIAFFRAFFDTLMAMMLAVNAVFFGAIASVVGVYLWKRDRRLRDAAPGETRSVSASEQSASLPNPAADNFPPELASVCENAPASTNEVGESRVGGFDATLKTNQTPSRNGEGDRESVSQDRQTVASANGTSNSSSGCLRLIQAQLARRLDVSPSTVGKRKHKPDFPTWAQTKDPEDLRWHYCHQTKQFYPETDSASEVSPSKQTRSLS